MKKYFYSDGKEKHGPLRLDEMKPILELQPPPILNEDKNELDKPEENTIETTVKKESKNRSIKKGMFSSPFSFDGRIRPTEYRISLIIYVIVATFVNAIIESGEAQIMGLAYIPMLWFLWAQGAKKCHYVGNNGWWQIIPFYVVWLLFQDGQPGLNEYSQNPKG